MDHCDNRGQIFKVELYFASLSFHISSGFSQDFVQTCHVYFFFRGGLNLNQELKRTIIADSFLEFEVLIEDRSEPRSIFVVTL